MLIEKVSNLEDSIHKFSLRVLWELSNGSQRLNFVSSQMQSLSIETCARSIPMQDEESQQQEGGLEIGTKFVHRELGAGLVFDGDSFFLSFLFPSFFFMGLTTATTAARGCFVVATVRLPVLIAEE